MQTARTQSGVTLIESICVLALVGGLTSYTFLMADQVETLIADFPHSEYAIQDLDSFKVKLCN